MYFQLVNKYYVYILANKTNSVLYVGVTNNLERRIYEHKNKQMPGFTEKYNVSKLVWYEECSDVKAAIQREKNLKKWKRSWKNALIEKENPDYKDLCSELE
ncbi:MAG: GIY-YIG nuclease family protein [Spirochaetales bacterium]|nr:GIY-YIG nuclease family protein [Spirochaetales bacterium]